MSRYNSENVFLEWNTIFVLLNLRIPLKFDDFLNKIVLQANDQFYIVNQKQFDTRSWCLTTKKSDLSLSVCGETKKGEGQYFKANEGQLVDIKSGKCIRRNGAEVSLESCNQRDENSCPYMSMDDTLSFFDENGIGHLSLNKRKALVVKSERRYDDLSQKWVIQEIA